MKTSDKSLLGISLDWEKAPRVFRAEHSLWLEQRGELRRGGVEEKGLV